MEVREIAACGISLREFAVEFEETELADVYRILLYARKGVGFYDEDLLDDWKSQMSYIIGPSVEEDPSDEPGEPTIRWEETGTSYNLVMNENEAKRIYKTLMAVEHPGEDLDKELNQHLLDQMMEMAPMLLDNLPTINR
jgi:hypothetical protein